MPLDGSADAPEPDPDRELPFLPDPYVPLASAPRPEPAPPPPRPAPPRASLSRLALSAIVSALFLGPPGAIAAVLFGWYGRREIEASGGRRSGHGLATAGMVLGLCLTPAWGGFLSYLVWTHALRTDPGGETDSASDEAEPQLPQSRPGVLPQPAIPPHAVAPAIPVVPARTTVTREGRITVVEIGRDTPSLSEALARQRAQAGGAHETVVLMITGSACDPCRGVDRSLADPLMQTALGGVRLVRVDGAFFSEDLEALHVPHEAIPGFFLLSPDLTPRDGIDGGEWGDDIATNIAPVLGAFVRGKYAVRRRSWTPLPPSGVSL